MRRPGRLRVSVQRSIGVAEHHACTGLTRRNVTRFLAVACISAFGVFPAVAAHAATTGDQIAATSRAIDSAATALVRGAGRRGPHRRQHRERRTADHDRAGDDATGPQDRNGTRGRHVQERRHGSFVDVRRQRARLGPPRPPRERRQRRRRRSHRPVDNCGRQPARPRAESRSTAGTTEERVPRGRERAHNPRLRARERPRRGSTRGERRARPKRKLRSRA